MVSWQTHPTSGIPHLDLLLVYTKGILNTPTHYDYLLKHGDLTRYKKLNEAILSYGTKQDKAPFTSPGFNPYRILNQKKLVQSPYQLMKAAMLQDPFHFDVHRWLSDNNLDIAASKSHWQKAVALLKKQQQVQCNRIHASKPGCEMINRTLMRTLLPDRKYRSYTRNAQYYDPVVTKLNQIVLHGFHRPHKTKNLLIVSPPNTGKTSLALQIQKHVSVYYMGVHNWFPAYRSNVYKMILWNQFNLNTMAYPELLNLLQGTKLDLQYKGGSVLKTDNQLIYMTSNMTLQQHICSRFKSQTARELARANLRARVDQVILPQGVDLFLLQKLIVPKPAHSTSSV
jgi:hypothetical protein